MPQESFAKCGPIKGRGWAPGLSDDGNGQVGKQQTVDGRSPQPFHSCTILLKLVLVGSFSRTICRYVVISDGVIPRGAGFVL